MLTVAFVYVKQERRSCRLPQTGEMKGMKLPMFLVLAVMVVTSSALAGLGDDSERIEDLYGTIVQRRLRDDGTVSVVYAKGRYLYLVTFANQKSISESYSHMNGTDLSEREITRFLKTNGTRWLPMDKGVERRFKTSDGTAEAIYAPVNGRPALTVRELRDDHRR
jgi:hypothetical protein